MNTSKEILTKAREILAERGVNRDGWFIDSDACKVCILGSVYLAAGGKIKRETYTESQWDASTDTDVVVEKSEVNIGGYNYTEAGEATWIIEKVLKDDPRATSRFAWTSQVSVPHFNDTSTSDDEVLAVLDRAIAIAE